MRKENITMRTTHKEKQYLQSAAEIAGYSNLTNFIMTAARKEATQVISNINNTFVSAKDWGRIAELVEESPEPNQALIDLLSSKNENQ